jgi:uncharacterized protein YkwD
MGRHAELRPRRKLPLLACITATVLVVGVPLAAPSFFGPDPSELAGASASLVDEAGSATGKGSAKHSATTPTKAAKRTAAPAKKPRAGRASAPRTTTPKPTTKAAPPKTTKPKATTQPKSTGSSDGAATSDAKEVLRLTNVQRAANGCDALTWNTKLATAAAKHSADMAANDYFSHDSLDGRDPFQRMKDEGYSFSAAAENIAAGQPTPADVVDGWMNSSGHRANILNCGLTELGVGVARGGSYGVYWTQDFGTPA